MKKKFNIIDAIIIFVIVAVIAVACFLYFNMNGKEQNITSTTNTLTVDFTVEVINLEKDTAEFFRSVEGQNVNFGLTSSGVGCISKVEVIPYKKITQDTGNGEYKLTEVPDRFSVKVTIRSEVAKTDISYSSNDEVITVGKSMPFNSNGVASEDSYVIDLVEVK